MLRHAEMTLTRQHAELNTIVSATVIGREKSFLEIVQWTGTGIVIRENVIGTGIGMTMTMITSVLLCLRQQILRGVVGVVGVV